MDFSEWLKTEGNSMDSIAKQLGTTRQAVHGWASGRMRPRVFYAVAIEALSNGQVPVQSWLSPVQRMAIEGFKARQAAPSVP